MPGKYNRLGDLIKLHYDKVAINFTKTECESQDIDLFNGEQKQDWYQKINPKGKVPALEMDDGTTLTESTVIAKYIIRKAGGHSIYPGEKITHKYK